MAQTAAADWHNAHRHRRGQRPKVTPAYVGNKGSLINSATNLQRKLSRQRREAIEAARIAAMEA